MLKILISQQGVQGAPDPHPHPRQLRVEPLCKRRDSLPPSPSPLQFHERGLSPPTRDGTWQLYLPQMCHKRICAGGGDAGGSWHSCSWDRPTAWLSRLGIPGAQQQGRNGKGLSSSFIQVGHTKANSSSSLHTLLCVSLVPTVDSTSDMYYYNPTEPLNAHERDHKWFSREVLLGSCMKSTVAAFAGLSILPCLDHTPCILREAPTHRNSHSDLTGLTFTIWIVGPWASRL